MCARSRQSHSHPHNGGIHLKEMVSGQGRGRDGQLRYASLHNSGVGRQRDGREMDGGGREAIRYATISYDAIDLSNGYDAIDVLRNYAAIVCVPIHGVYIITILRLQLLI